MARAAVGGSERQGVLMTAGAFCLWGLFPLYFPLLKPAGALEILGHRVVWSLAFVLVLLALRRSWAWVGLLLHDRRRLLLLLVAAVAIAINWGVYIWAVNADHVIDAALGYYINPLVTVLLGVVLLRERLSRGQVAAVCLAGLAVLILTVAYGKVPVIALVLACSFATYSLVKKVIGMPALESLAGETTLLFLPAVVMLLSLHGQGEAEFGNAGVGHVLLLISAGPVTAIPLLLFGAGARRVPLTTVGLLQYITPTLQFLIGWAIFHEEVPPARLAGFALVWAALVVFTADALVRGRREPSDAEELAPV